VAGGRESHGSDLLPTHAEPGGGHGSGGHGEESPVKRFWGLLRAERPDLWTIAVFSLVSGLLYLGLPLAMNALVSNLAFGTQSAPFQQALLVMALAVFGALLLSGLIRALQYYLVEVIQRRIFVRVASAMAYRLPRLKVEALDGVHAPELVNRFLDVVTVQKTTALLLLDGINLVLGASIGLVLLGFYHPFLLSFSVLIVLAIGGVIFVLGKGAVKTSIQESICKYDLVSWLEEIARYPRIFKGSGGYAMAIERTDELCHAFLKARGSHFRVLMRQILGLVVLEVVATSALLVVGGWLVLSMQITLGQLVASELIVGAIVASLPKLAKKFEAWYDAMAAMDKLGHLVDLELETEGGEVPRVEAPNLAVKLTDASLAYPEGNTAFEGLSTEVEPGARVALMGAEGAGASSLLDVLFGLRSLSSGYVMLAGLDLRSWNLEELRKNVLLLRAHDIVEGSVAENVRLGRRDVGLEVVQEALESVGLLRFVMQFPQGIHTALITGGSMLSSRQRVRLLLARALALKPRLLLVDELFDALDAETAQELMQVIFDPERKWTVFVATRDPRIAGGCTRRLVLGAHGTEA
jgi:putative ABC transport system ATP-binding protein